MASANFVQLSTLWDININTSEEDKELAWARLSTMFNTSAGTNVRYATNSVY